MGSPPPQPSILSLNNPPLPPPIHPPLPPPAQQPQQQWQHDYPPISAMLVREAEAWRALTSLHGSILGLGRTLTEQQFEEEEEIELSDQRESSYLAAIAQLNAACDLLVAEATKIRGLRKARRQLDIQRVYDVLRQHSNETLAVGESSARHGALNLTALGADFRLKIQKMRNELDQARALCEAAFEITESKGLASLCLSFEIEGDQVKWPVSDIFQKIHQSAGCTLTAQTLKAVLLGQELVPNKPVPTRTFVRRGVGDRSLQRELIEKRTTRMLSLKTADDRKRELNLRKNLQLQHEKDVSRLVNLQDSDGQTGCGFCRIFGQRTTKSSNSSSGQQSSSRIFGVSKVKSATEKLTVAAEAMRERVASLETQAGAARLEAKRNFALGNKAQALRALKRSKQCEKQAQANASSLVALEQQVELFEQARLQKQVAAALQASSKGLRGQKKLLENAESAVEGASEARDVAEDLGVLIADFANGTMADDDEELMAELMQMVGDEEPPHPPTDTDAIAIEESSAAANALMLLQEQHDAHDAALRLRSALPSAPQSRGKGKDKVVYTALLAENGH